jgi:hypothetical protein
VAKPLKAAKQSETKKKMKMSTAAALWAMLVSDYKRVSEGWQGVVKQAGRTRKFLE